MGFGPIALGFLTALQLASFEDIRSKKVEELIGNIQTRIEQVCKTDTCKSILGSRLKHIQAETQELATAICPENFMPEGMKDQNECIDILQKFLLLRIGEILANGREVDIEQLKEEATKFLRSQ